MSFFYSFIETLVHSLWQSALLVLFYACAGIFVKSSSPLQKRNILYSLLLTQLFVSVATFFICFNGNGIATQGIYNNSIFTGLYGYADLIFYAYAAAVLFNASRLSLQWRGFKIQYRRGISRPLPELKVFTEIKAHQLGIKTKVSLWYSAHIHTPLTFGMLKPVILLPLSLLNHISMPETEAIILHELAHIKSMDHLLNRFLLVTENLFFFNPFIRIIAKKIRLEREKNCDVQVMNFDYPALLYAEALLKTARTSSAIRSFQLGAIGKTPQLLRRIEFFTGRTHFDFNKRRAGWVSAFFIPAFIAAALFFLPGPRPQARTYNNLQTRTYSLQARTEMPATTVYNVALPQNNPTTPNPKPQTPITHSAPITETADAIMIPAIAAAYNETPDSVKEMIYKIETPQGIMTQSFKMTLIKGQWTMQPQWMLLETGPDSTRKAAADTVWHNLMPQ